MEHIFFPFRVNNITSASLTDLNTKAAQSNLAVFAGAFTQGRYDVTVGDRHFTFSGLPFAAREIASLARTIPNTTQHLNQDFNRDSMLQMNDYNIVHLATHAEFALGHPENSFILFGNGDRITLQDVEAWNLPNVDVAHLPLDRPAQSHA